VNRRGSGVIRFDGQCFLCPGSEMDSTTGYLESVWPGRKSDGVNCNVLSHLSIRHCFNSFDLAY